MDNRGEVVAQTPLSLNGWKCWERTGWGDWWLGEEWGCGEVGEDWMCWEKCWLCIVTYRAGSLAIQGLQENYPALFLILQSNDWRV